MKRILYIVTCLLLLAGCSYNPPQDSSMVLEAWIDANGHPVVMIHKSYVLANAPDSVQSLEQIIEQQLIPFGKVTFSDGEQEVVMTGRLDTMYMPPYTYTTIDIIGEPGKRYTVTAKYKDLHATATTTIPPIATLDSLSVQSSSMGMVDVTGYMTLENPLEETYYTLFARKKGAKQFQLCPFGVFDSRDAKDGQFKMKVYNPISHGKDYEALASYFAVGDSADYQLRVARVDYPTYCFWKEYNENILSRGVLFVPIYKNMPTNVVGGIGFFSGFGSSIYQFSLLNDTTYRY